MNARSLSEHDRELLAQARREAEARSPDGFESWLRGFCLPVQKGCVGQSAAVRRELIALKTEYCRPRD